MILDADITIEDSLSLPLSFGEMRFLYLTTRYFSDPWNACVIVKAQAEVQADEDFKNID